jgi:hypothetical protein
VATNDLEMDPARNIVSFASTGTEEETFAHPNPLVNMVSLFWTKFIATPGTRNELSNSSSKNISTNSSIAVEFINDNSLSKEALML